MYGSSRSDGLYKEFGLAQHELVAFGLGHAYACHGHLPVCGWLWRGHFSLWSHAKGMKDLPEWRRCIHCTHCQRPRPQLAGWSCKIATLTLRLAIEVFFKTSPESRPALGSPWNGWKTAEELEQNCLKGSWKQKDQRSDSVISVSNRLRCLNHFESMFLQQTTLCSTGCSPGVRPHRLHPLFQPQF